MTMNCNFDKSKLNLLTKEELVELLEKCQDNKLTENTNKNNKIETIDTIASIDYELIKIKKQYEYQKKKLREYNTKTYELLDKINHEKKFL